VVMGHSQPSSPTEEAVMREPISIHCVDLGCKSAYTISMRTAEIVSANLNRRVERLGHWGYSRRALSLAAGHHERWLTQALDLSRRPGGWTLDMLDKLAEALAEDPLALLREDYNPELSPPPDLVLDDGDDAYRQALAELIAQMFRGSQPQHSRISVMNRRLGLKSPQRMHIDLVIYLLHELFAPLLDRSADIIDVSRCLGWVHPVIRVVRAEGGDRLDLRWSNGGTLAEYAIHGRKLFQNSPSVTIYRKEIAHWLRNRTDAVVWRLVTSLRSAIKAVTSQET
jgi:hypothetical protein